MTFPADLHTSSCETVKILEELNKKGSIHLLPMLSKIL